jgi:hypothetical protein
MNKLPEHISYSSFNTWLECGWKYKLTKMYEVPEKHAVWLTGGTAVHKATERFDLDEMGETLNPDELWNEVWHEQIIQDEKIHGDMNTWEFRSREDMSWWYGEGWWMLSRWIEFREGGWEVYKDFVEKQYEVSIEGTKVKLAIDRVLTDYDGNRVLVDIKTGASSQKHPLQLAVYAWALAKEENLVVDKAGFWDARTGHITLWDLEHLQPDRIEEIFKGFDSMRKTETFLPNMNSCGRCGVLSYCKWMNGNKSKGYE